MNGWLQGGILTVALIAGFLTGWFLGRGTRLRMPSVWISAVVLIVGSLGGPLLAYKTLGPTLWSYIAALLLAGFTAGITFWPMGEKQGEKKWL